MSETKPVVKLKRYTVDSIHGYEGAETLMTLIVRYADSHGWKSGEVQRIADLPAGESFQIADLTITRTS